MVSDTPGGGLFCLTFQATGESPDEYNYVELLPGQR
jgi:hypothetical protein